MSPVVLMEVEGHLELPSQTLKKNLVEIISQEGKLVKSCTWALCTVLRRKNIEFGWWSRVIWGRQRSESVNIEICS